MKNVVILDSKRTAIGKAYKGSLRDTRSDVFASMLLKQMLVKNKINVNDIEDIIVGCAMPEGEQGMNIARTIGILSSLPYCIPAFTVNRFCASGLQAISNLAQSIETKSINLGIAGGVESMSMVPMGGYHFSANTDIVENNIDFYTTMGMTAENIADLYNISRLDQDKFSLNSHMKARHAIENNLFTDEIETMKVYTYDKHVKKYHDFCIDDGPRDTSIDKLSKLKPSFKKQGSVTAGNSSQMSDGAAFSFLSSIDYAKKNNLSYMGYFREFCVAGVSPNIMGIGPVPAIKKLLKKTGLKINDIGLFELNEAFAAQALYCIRQLGLDEKIVNVNGGAIAHGHPLGCTGARQITTLLYEMKRRKIRYGVVSMCIGGGMGAAALIESV